VLFIFSLNYLLSTLLLVLLLLISAVISGSEVAFFSLSKTALENEENENLKVKKVIKLLEKPDKLLATILVTNNFINIGIVILSHYLIEAYFTGKTLALEFFGTSFNFKVVFEMVIITFLILLFGEILPKVYASRNKLKFASFMASPLAFFNKILSPLTSLMTSSTRFIKSKIGSQKTDITVDKLSQALELTDESETTEDEQKILEGIVNFGNTLVTEIMQPRISIFALNKDTSFKDMIKQVVDKGHARIPIYEDNIDTVIGILFIKDLLAHFDKKDFDWLSLIREPFFVPENKKLDDLLRDFQDKKVHLAIVVDEYGGTSGLVTLEDVIEEIVGDLSDEFDNDDLSYSKIDDKTYIFEGKTALKDFCKVIDVDCSIFDKAKGESESLAGLVLELSGSFPKKGHKINFENFSFIVEVMDKKRIKQLKVILA
jgi:gliding motility-associated protein GldE